MDLPRCYNTRENIHEGAVPIDVRDEAFEMWGQTRYFPKFDPPAGWSSDWALCSSLQNWVLPFPRWRTLSVDEAYHNEETWNRLLRFDLGTSGDINIVPIMYKEPNHHFVIFTIAQRIYYFLGARLVMIWSTGFGRFRFLRTIYRIPTSFRNCGAGDGEEVLYATDIEIMRLWCGQKSA